MLRRSLVLAAIALTALAFGTGCSKKSTPAPMPTPTLSPAPNPDPYSFHGQTGSLVAVAVGQAPAAVNLVAYENISALIQFGSVTSGSGTIAVSDAINNGDVSPDTLPADTSSSTGYSGILYVAFYNPNATAIVFGSSTPQVTLTDSGGFGSQTTCSLDFFSLSTDTWNASGASGAISGNSVTIPATPLQAGSTTQFPATTEVITAISCK